MRRTLAIIAIIATVATPVAVALQRAQASWESRVESAGLATGLAEAKEELQRAQERLAVARLRAEFRARRAP
jgi:putative ubiquitin-RnfH superfamily antitoxin RatB of RatAB toxin-antitoxin module